jgi:hypothetical protein
MYKQDIQAEQQSVKQAGKEFEDYTKMYLYQIYQELGIQSAQVKKYKMSAYDMTGVIIAQIRIYKNKLKKAREVYRQQQRVIRDYQQTDIFSLINNKQKSCNSDVSA